MAGKRPKKRLTVTVVGDPTRALTRQNEGQSRRSIQMRWDARREGRAIAEERAALLGGARAGRGTMLMTAVILALTTVTLIVVLVATIHAW